MKDRVTYWLTNQIDCLPLSIMECLCTGKDPRRTVRRLVSDLVRQSALELEPMLVPSVSDAAPILVHDPSQPAEHDWEALAYKLTRRDQSLRSDLVATATAEARKVYGGQLGRPLRAVDATHHFRLSHVFVALGTPNAWVHEAELLSRGLWTDAENVPDAALLTEGTLTLIEVCGRYPADKLARRGDAWASYPYRLY